MVADLWAHDLSAELAADARSPEELLARYRDDKHSWIIIIKQDVDVFGKADLKVKSMDRKVDTDVRSSELISYLRQEIRDRDHREGTNERARLLRQPSQPESAQAERKSNVQVLMAQHRSKKSNKWNVVEAGKQLTFASIKPPLVAFVTGASKWITNIPGLAASCNFLFTFGTAQRLIRFQFPASATLFSLPTIGSQHIH